MRFFSMQLGLAALMCGAAVSSGQQTPMDAATAMATGGLNGNWKNVDARTRGLVRIVVDGTKVHPYGACSPVACDWGVIAGQAFASKVDLRDMSSLLVSDSQGFVRRVMTVSIEPDGRLRVQVFNHYTDASRRADSSFVDYFVRQ